jgi:hypothetical protein
VRSKGSAPGVIVHGGRAVGVEAGTVGVRIGVGESAAGGVAVTGAVCVDVGLWGDVSRGEAVAGIAEGVGGGAVSPDPQAATKRTPATINRQPPRASARRMACLLPRKRLTPTAFDRFCRGAFRA